MDCTVTQSFELSSSARLVKAADVQTVCDAQSVIAAAEAEAARLVDAAKVAFAEERRTGYAKGLADVQAEVSRRKLELADESAAFMASVEEKMGDIVMKALRKCVEEIGDRELVVQVVRKVMKVVVRNQRQITLRVAPRYGRDRAFAHGRHSCRLPSPGRSGCAG